MESGERNGVEFGPFLDHVHHLLKDKNCKKRAEKRKAAKENEKSQTWSRTGTHGRASQEDYTRLTPPCLNFCLSSRKTLYKTN